MQEKNECVFCIVDLHAITTPYEPKELQKNISDTTAVYLAAGIDPDKSIIFIQSHVPEHLELYMIFSLITPLGWLERCPTYKEQLREVTNRDLSTYGFLGYPVLQAADIMLYKAEAVPVGEDQLPHLELTREIARRFNSLYKKNIFPEPTAVLTKAPRILGLDGRKMSKSYNNFIAISEEPKDIRVKVQGMFTDPERIKLSDPGHPQICNVHSYYALFAPEREKEVADFCRNAKCGCSGCKKELAEVLIKFLHPIQNKRDELLKDKKQVSNILKQGAKRAEAFAEKTMSEVKGLLNLSSHPK